MAVQKEESNKDNWREQWKNAKILKFFFPQRFCPENIFYFSLSLSLSLSLFLSLSFWTKSRNKIRLDFTCMSLTW